MSTPAAAVRVDAAASRFCCPLCHSDLDVFSGGYECWRCARRYPIRLGIPDFRVFPDPYIGIDEEVEKARRVAEMARRASFEETVRYYWHLTPDVPEAEAARFVRYACGGAVRGGAIMRHVAPALAPAARGACLDLGCGTGGLTVAAEEWFADVVGVDIALRWLIIARQRLLEAGACATLVCACAEALPFRPAAFDAVIGVDLLEHTADRRRILGEVGRVLRPGASYVFLSPNRYSLGPEPCVRVWGVGFLPRAWAARYVQRVTGLPYRHISLLSGREARRLLHEVGLGGARVEPAPIANVDGAALPRPARVLARAYNRLCRLPILRTALRLCGPLLHISGRKPASGASRTGRSEAASRVSEPT